LFFHSVLYMTEYQKSHGDRYGQYAEPETLTIIFRVNYSLILCPL
jgi:hypothetical protein